MRALLDTHTLLWSFLGDGSLSATARRIIADGENEIMVSAASAWELATKARIGKLPAAVDLVQDFSANLETFNFLAISVSVEDAIRAGLLPGHHKDPFDRLLAAQCQAESIPIISNDKIFELYGVRRIW